MLDLKINTRFAEYFEELDYGQTSQLTQSLKSDLTSEPILWWHNPEKSQNEILDGHHRYYIAKQHKLDIQFHEKHFESEDHALLFVIRTQTTRRNIVNRQNVLKFAVDLEIKLGKSKTQAVQETALLTSVSERSVWRAVEEEKPKSAVQQFFDDKKVYERDLERVRNKEVEKLKQRAVKGGYQEDEDRLAVEWEVVEAEIQKQFTEQTSKLESVAESIQMAQDADGGRPANVGGKRSTKKSTKDRAARRNTFKKALSLIAKLRNEAFYFWTQNGCGSVSIESIEAALKAFVQQVEDEQASDAKAAKKRKFGGKK